MGHVEGCDDESAYFVIDTGFNKRGAGFGNVYPIRLIVLGKVLIRFSMLATLVGDSILRRSALCAPCFEDYW